MWYQSGVRLRARPWVVALVACSVAGVWLALAADDLPGRFGWYMAAASFAAGLLFGVRGAVLTPAGIVAFGIVLLAKAMPPPSGDSEPPVIVVLFFMALPAMFAVPAAVAALLRHRVRWARRP